MAEDTIPHRRQIETVECEFEGIRFYLTLGFYPGGRVGEIQVSGFKHGAHVDLMMEDACALISALLQRFVSPQALQDMMARKSDGGPASLIGATVFQLVESVSEDGDANE
jgi:hypothetical protein